MFPLSSETQAEGNCSCSVTGLHMGLSVLINTPLEHREDTEGAGSRARAGSLESSETMFQHCLSTRPTDPHGRAPRLPPLRGSEGRGGGRGRLTWRTKLLEVVSEEVLPSDRLNRPFRLGYFTWKEETMFFLRDDAFSFCYMNRYNMLLVT